MGVKLVFKFGGIIMKIHWKGKLSDINSFSESDIPKDFNILLDGKSSLLDYAAIIGVFVILYFLTKIKRSIYPEFRIDLFGVFIGILLSILFLPIHELIHCIFCPQNMNINLYYSIYGITCFPLDALSKWRYIIMALAPAILMGVIPMVIWIFIPTKYILINSICIVFGTTSLSTSTVDIKNAILAIINVPSDGYIQAWGNKVYWFR